MLKRKSVIQLLKKVSVYLLVFVLAYILLVYLSRLFVYERKHIFTRLKFSPSGDSIAGRSRSSASGEHLRYKIFLWSFKDEYLPLEIAAKPETMTFSPDSRYFVYSNYGKVVIVDRKEMTERIIGNKDTFNIENPRLLKYTDDGKVLAFGGYSDESNNSCYEVYYIDLNKNKIIGKTTLSSSARMVGLEGKSWPDLTLKYLIKTDDVSSYFTEIYDVKRNKIIKRYKTEVKEIDISFECCHYVSFSKSLNPIDSLKSFNLEFDDKSGNGISEFEVSVIEKNNKGNNMVKRYPVKGIADRSFVNAAYSQQSGLFALGYGWNKGYFRWQDDGRILVYNLKTGKVVQNLSVKGQKFRKVKWIKGELIKKNDFLQ